MASKKIKLTSQTAWETQKDLNENFAAIDEDISALETAVEQITIPTKTSDLTNDGDGSDSNSPFATQAYVAANGGKIDSISVNGVAQTIDANKNVDITVPADTNQKVKSGNVTFGNDDVVEIVGGTNVTVTGDASNKTITIASSYTDTGATDVEVTGAGNAVTTGSYDSATRKITLTKGETFQTATDNSLNTTSKTITGAINEVNSIAKQANVAKSYTSYSALITDLNSATATAYNVGQSFYIQTKEVPDIWVISVESSSVAYTYTTDAAFITATGATGGQQVGYYKLAQLETQKVDLANYVQKTTTIAGVDLQDDITKTEFLTALNVADGAQVNTVDSVNSKTGTVVLDADDISDTSTTNKFVTATDKSTWNAKQNAIQDISFTASDAGWSAIDSNGFYTLTIDSTLTPENVFKIDNNTKKKVMAGLDYDATHIYVITDTKFAGVVSAR